MSLLKLIFLFYLLPVLCPSRFHFWILVPSSLSRKSQLSLCLQVIFCFASPLHWPHLLFTLAPSFYPDCSNHLVHLLFQSQGSPASDWLPVPVFPSPSLLPNQSKPPCGSQSLSMCLSPAPSSLNIARLLQSLRERVKRVGGNRSSIVPVPQAQGLPKFRSLFPVSKMGDGEPIYQDVQALDSLSHSTCFLLLLLSSVLSLNQIHSSTYSSLISWEGEREGEKRSLRSQEIQAPWSQTLCPLPSHKRSLLHVLRGLWRDML